MHRLLYLLVVSVFLMLFAYVKPSRAYFLQKHTIDEATPLTTQPLALSADWIAESNKGGTWLGTSVSTAGDVNGDGYLDLIVGAHAYDNGETNEGALFVYLGSPTGLSDMPALIVEGNQANAQFGWAVSSAGDVNADGYSDVIVGARYYDNPETNEGRAYLYLGSATGLESTPAWIAEGWQANAQFGWAVSYAGDVNNDGYSDVIIGARLYDNSQTNEGRAYLYLGSASGLSATPAWTAEGSQAAAHFGWAVSNAGDVNDDGYDDVIIGARYYDNGETNEGRAFVYLGSAIGLNDTPRALHIYVILIYSDDQHQKWCSSHLSCTLLLRMSCLA